MTRTFSIGELARAFGVTTRTIRFYEDKGILAPLRDGRRRVFRPRDRTRLKLILRGKRLGFSLEEIREIVDLYDAPAGETAQLKLLLERIGTRRAELKAKRRDIDASLRDLDEVAENCRKALKDIEEKEARSGTMAARAEAGR